MKPLCVFCGKKPQNKNKEHIFPQWLLKLTGFDQKKASVGSNWKTGKELVFNTLSYTFPSCRSCNDEFGKLEGKVKSIFDKLLFDLVVGVKELELLLDWFDKVRIGAWLGVKYMNKDIFTMEPKYYISSRIGIKDRYLSVTNTYKEEITLNWSGVNTLAFMLSPTAFSLRVNNLVFVNCSSDFIVSKQLGFPYVAFEIPTPSEKTTDLQFEMPTKQPGKKIFKTKLYSPNIEIAQPIFTGVKGGLDDYYEHDYIKNNSYDYNCGIGKIFVSKQGKFESLERNDELNFSMPEAKSNFGHVEVVRPILQLQAELIKNKKKDLRNLTLEQKKDEIMGKKNVINSLKEQMRLYRY